MIPGLLLPRGYLSYSAYTIWKTNPERFRREYFEKGPKLDTKYLRFGKLIAEMIEDGSYKILLPNLPVYPKHEHEIKCEVQGVPILSYLDGDDNECGIIGEYKTGKRDKKGRAPWSLAKAQKHEQFVYYAVAKRAETGIMPQAGYLHWIETIEAPEVRNGPFRNERKIVTTGHIETFHRVFDVRELDRLEVDIVKVALEISEAYKSFIAEI